MKQENILPKIKFIFAWITTFYFIDFAKNSHKEFKEFYWLKSFKKWFCSKFTSNSMTTFCSVWAKKKKKKKKKDLLYYTSSRTLKQPSMEANTKYVPPTNNTFCNVCPRRGLKYINTRFIDFFKKGRHIYFLGTEWSES